jgi:hypothetical protein
LLGHWLSFNPNIIKSNRRNDGSALARRAKPARAKTIRTIGNLLIKMLLLPIIASQTSLVKIK